MCCLNVLIIITKCSSMTTSWDMLKKLRLNEETRANKPVNLESVYLQLFEVSTRPTSISYSYLRVAV